MVLSVEDADTVFKGSFLPQPSVFSPDFVA